MTSILHKFSAFTWIQFWNIIMDLLSGLKKREKKEISKYFVKEQL